MGKNLKTESNIKNLNDRSSFQKYKSYLRPKIESTGLNLVAIIPEMDNKIDFVITDIQSVEEAEKAKDIISSLFGGYDIVSVNSISLKGTYKEHSVDKAIKIVIEYKEKGR